MNRMEQAALEHAAAWLRYEKSGRANADLIKDKARRVAADRKSGHSPKCTLTKCHPECRR